MRAVGQARHQRSADAARMPARLSGSAVRRTGHGSACRVLGCSARAIRDDATRPEGLLRQSWGGSVRSGRLQDPTLYDLAVRSDGSLRW